MLRFARLFRPAALLVLAGLALQGVHAADPQVPAQVPGQPAAPAVPQDISPSATLAGRTAASSGFGGLSLSSLGGALVVVGVVAAASGGKSSGSTAATSGTSGS